MTHLVWDWNGTLLDDLALTIEATNASLRAVGGPTVTLDRHRRGFRWPLVDYYAEVLGHPLAEGEFSQIDEVFHAVYRSGLPACGLAADAHCALEAWAGTQSLLSMASHAHLVPEVERRGLVDRLLRVDGRPRNGTTATKGRYLVRHLAALGLDGADCVLIGDCVDDAAAAARVGAGCVLYAGGITHVDVLRATGYRVADTLMEAIGLAQAPGSEGAAGHATATIASSEFLDLPPRAAQVPNNGA